MYIDINFGFRNLRHWKDSKKRSEHIANRIALRGIGKSQILEAIKRGAKRIRSDGSIIAEYRWFKIIYREFKTKKFTKVYPVTVIEI